jgi:hypothetical protein
MHSLYELHLIRSFRGVPYSGIGRLWSEGSIEATIVDNLEDYLQEIESFIEKKNTYGKLSPDILQKPSTRELMCYLDSTTDNFSYP